MRAEMLRRGLKLLKSSCEKAPSKRIFASIADTLSCILTSAKLLSGGRERFKAICIRSRTPSGAVQTNNFDFNGASIRRTSPAVSGAGYCLLM